MSSFRTAGIVLGRTNLGEADRIITILSPDLGKIRAVARGVRKIKSRVAGHVEPFSRVEFMMAEGHSMPVITSARLVEYPHGLSESYDRLELAFLVAQMVDRLTQEKLPQPQLFELLGVVLRSLRRPLPTEMTELYFKLRMLGIQGYDLQLDHCVGCGSEEVVALSVERGGMVCANCRGADAALAEQPLKLWRLVRRYELGVFEKIGDAAVVAGQSLALCDEVYDYYFGRRFTRMQKPRVELIP